MEPSLLAPVTQLSASTLFDKLRAYDQRDDRAFDDLVMLASMVCEAPIALVSFVDDEEQWFRAKTGLMIDRTSREVAFCARTVDAGVTTIVPDARIDPRFAANPLVTGEPHVRFYAGVPLRVGGSLPLGTLCVLDRVARTLRPEQLAGLEALARQVERLLRLQVTTAARIRDQAALIERDARFASVIDALAQGVVVHAVDGSIERANPVAQQILGLSEAEMRGLTPADQSWEAVREDGSPFPGQLHPASLTLATGQAVLGVVMGLRRSNAQQRWLIVSSVPLRGDSKELTGAVATFVDVTELLALNEQLRRSLDDVTAASVERASLLASLSHDLRAPLGAIKIRGELLRDHASEFSVAQRHDMLHQIVLDAARTATSLTDLVSSDRTVESLLTVRRRDVDLAEIVLQSVLALDEPTHRLVIDDMSTAVVEADPIQMRRIVDNLIGNALKHTPSGTEIRLSVTTRDGWVELTVDDDGPGIEESAGLSIFDAYVRGADTHDRPGSGLGLFLARRFAEFHHGHVSYQASSRGGASFSVRIPQHPAPPSPNE